MPKRSSIVHDPIVEGVAEVHADHEFDSNTLRFRRAVTQIIGEDQFVYLARRDSARLSRLATGPMRMKPLRWSNLTDEQVRRMEEIVPYRGVDDLVSYGDTVLMICPLGRQEAIIQQRMAKAQTNQEAALSADALSRETGVRIDDRVEDLPASAVPRTP